MSEAPTNPPAGGSYIRDAKSGALTLVATTAPHPQPHERQAGADAPAPTPEATAAPKAPARPSIKSADTKGDAS